MTDKNTPALDQKIEIAKIAAEIVKAGNASRNGINKAVGGSGPDAPYLSAFKAAYDFVSAQLLNPQSAPNE